jgi:hypothetical protein
MSKAISSQATKRVTLEAGPLNVSSRAAAAQFSVPTTSIHTVEADGGRVFYRAAGDPTAPVILLLHGFPASSFMFREANADATSTAYAGYPFDVSSDGRQLIVNSHTDQNSQDITVIANWLGWSQ